MQRLVIATALDSEAPIVIFDEPTSGVDHRHLTMIAEQLRALADAGRVVIVISHDPELLNHCADRVLDLGSPTPTEGSVDEPYNAA